MLELIGTKIGMLSVLERATNQGKQTMMLCACDCGGSVVMQVYKLRTHPDPDCGCRRKDKIGNANRKHGYYATPTYESWAGIKQRVGKVKNYEHIAVCNRWALFENFLEDMGPRPEGTTIDRIDNEKGYEPGNCRWATKEEQARNRRYCVRLEHIASGKIMTVTEWASELGYPRTSLYRHVHAGKVPEGLRLCNQLHSGFP